MINPPIIVFDLDGTLADTILDLVAAMNRTIDSFQAPPVLASRVAHLTGKGGLKAMIEHAFKLNSMPIEQALLQHVFQETVKSYDENIANETKLYPNVETSLQKFSNEGWLLAVCTNKPVHQAKKLLQQLNIDTMFAAITGVDSFDFHKPDPRHLVRTIEIAGGSIDHAVMVGDTNTDILTAKNAGIPVIAVDFGYSDVHVQSLAPTRVISCFDRLFNEAMQLIR